jgi:hypothetical protein
MLTEALTIPRMKIQQYYGPMQQKFLENDDSRSIILRYTSGDAKSGMITVIMDEKTYALY